MPLHLIYLIRLTAMPLPFLLFFQSHPNPKLNLNADADISGVDTTQIQLG